MSDAGERGSEAGPSPMVHAGTAHGQRDGIRELEMRVREIFPVDADVFRIELGADVAPPAADSAAFIQSIFDKVAENLPQKVLIVEQIPQTIPTRVLRPPAFDI